MWWCVCVYYDMIVQFERVHVCKDADIPSAMIVTYYRIPLVDATFSCDVIAIACFIDCATPLKQDSMI